MATQIPTPNNFTRTTIEELYLLKKFHGVRISDLKRVIFTAAGRCRTKGQRDTHRIWKVEFEGLEPTKMTMSLDDFNKDWLLFHDYDVLLDWASPEGWRRIEEKRTAQAAEAVATKAPAKPFDDPEIKPKTTEQELDQPPLRLRTNNIKAIEAVLDSLNIHPDDRSKIPSFIHWMEEIQVRELGTMFEVLEANSHFVVEKAYYRNGLQPNLAVGIADGFYFYIRIMARSAKSYEIDVNNMIHALVNSITAPTCRWTHAPLAPLQVDEKAIAHAQGLLEQIEDLSSTELLAPQHVNNQNVPLMHALVEFLQGIDQYRELARYLNRLVAFYLRYQSGHQPYGSNPHREALFQMGYVNPPHYDHGNIFRDKLLRGDYGKRTR